MRANIPQTNVVATDARLPERKGLKVFHENADIPTVDVPPRTNGEGSASRNQMSRGAAAMGVRARINSAALAIFLMVALAMTMVFAMPNGALADEAGADGIETPTEQPVEAGDEPVEEGSATEGTDGTPGEQADESTNEGEQPVVEEDVEGDSATVPVALDAIGDSGVNTLAEAGQWTSDPDTHDDWYSGEDGISTGDNAGDSTRNTGRIWTDKSVYTSDVTLTSQSGEATFEIKNDEGTALVGLSALSSAANISGQTTINQPLDIVLVLDRSGSMDDGYLTGYTYSTAYSPNEGWGDNTRYYALNDDGSYAEIEERRSGFGNRDFDGWYLNGVRVFPKTSANDDDASHIQFYTRTQTSVRIDRAMESAVSNFIDTVAKENAGKNPEQQHRVSIVSYSSNADAYNAGSWRDPQYFVNCTEGDNVNGLKSYVTGLTYSGGTEAETGFREAQNIINGNGMGDGARPEAKKVVIFFTDGMPGDGDRVENDNAGQSVNIAREMKTAGVSIYSVGVFQGANPNDLSGTGDQEHDANYFMNAVSSNYPSASSSNTNNAWADFSNNCTLGERAEGNYYFAADNADALNDVFQSIYDDFGSGATSPIESNDNIGGEPVGYLTFIDTLGDYTEVKNFKSIVFAGEEFTQVSATPSGDGSTTTYVFQGSVDNGNDEGVVYPGSHSLSDIKITVTHGTTAQQGDTVEVQIPSTMLPMRLYTAVSNTVDGETTTTTEVLPAYPIRVYYTVGLKDGLVDAEGNLDASQIDGGYIESHTDADGNVFFYSNDYDGGNVGTTTATFTPADTNSFYYFTADTPLYESESTDNPARTYNPGTTYYYQRSYYANDAMHTEWVSIVAAEGQMDSYVDVASDGTYYIKKDSPRLTRATEFEAAKDENTTETAGDSIKPSWVNDQVVVTLGNNGKIAYPVSGDLQIAKTVDWGTTGAVHNDKEFTYTVDLGNANSGGAADIQGDFDYIKYNAQGQPVDAGGNQQQVDEGAEPAATGQIADGGTLTLKNGERVVVKGLPSDTAFTVTENAEAGYTAANTVEGTVSENGAVAAGTIASSDTIEVAYTNTYNVTSTSLADGSLHGTKVLTGRDWKDGESFTFTLSAVTPNAPMPDEPSVTLTNTDQTNYTENEEVTFSFGEIKYSSVGKYVYLIRETEGAESGLTYSGAVYRVTVNVTDNGEGNLAASIESMYRTFNDDSTSTGQDETLWPSIDDRNAVFTNNFLGDDVATANITGTKSFTDHTSGTTLDINDFQFTIAAVTQGAPMPAQTEVGNNGVGGITFGNIQFGIDDIDKTYEYEVREVIPAGATDNGDGTSTLNGMTYDNTAKTVSIAVTQDQSTGSVVATVNGNDFEFTNSYRASSVTTEGAADGLQITKQLDGAAGAEGQFKFTMVAANNETRDAIANGSVTGIEADGNVMTSPAIAKDGSANILFDNLTFTRPGTYTFNVTETQSAPNTAWKYDNHTYQVAFHVDDVDGQLVIADPITTSGSATFLNTYEASMNYDNEAGGVLFSKTLNGRALTANQFEFTVTTPDGDAASAEKLDEATTTLANRYGAADGVAALWRGIAGLTFDQDDAGQTYTFVVSETNNGTDGDGYTYDSTSVTVAIAVSDDGDGSMSTVTTVTKGDQKTTYSSKDFVRGDASTYPTAAFANSYDAADADPVSVSFEKQLTGRDWKDSDSFEFTLSADTDGSQGVTGDDLAAAMPETTTAAVSGADADKTFSFGDFTFTKVGTYAYNVGETQPAANTDTAGVTYDDSIAVVTFTVTDPGTGKLQVSTGISGVPLNDETGAGVFENTYTYTPATLEQNTDTGIGVQKNVTGAPNTEDFSFTAAFNADDVKNTGSAENIEGLTDGKLTATISDDFTAGETKAADFGTVTFKAPGVYVFDVTEDNTTTAAGWNYDNSTKQIVVTVADNLEGELVASVEGNDPLFYNTYYNPDDAKDVTSDKGDGSFAGVGDTLTYTIDWVNNAVDKNGVPQPAMVTITDEVPTGTTLVEGSVKSTVEPTSLTVQDGTIIWTLGSEDEPLQPGAAGTVSFEVTVNEDAVAAGQIENTAEVKIGNNDPQLTNKVVTDTAKKESAPAEGDTDGIQVGDVLTYTIDYQNTADEDGTVTVTDTLPESLTYVGVPEGATAPSVSTDGQTLTWTIENVPAGQGGTITFTARVNENAVTTSVDNKATIQVGDNSYTTNTTTDGTADTGTLTISKTIVPAEGTQVDTGKSFEFTVSVKDVAGNPLNGTYGNLTFENGVATIGLRHGESCSIQGLPAGANYTVTEAVTPAYTPNESEMSGPIEAGGEAIAAFENTYTVEPKSYDAQGDLNITKVLTGRDMTQGEFQAVITGDAAAMVRAGLAEEGAEGEVSATVNFPAAAEGVAATINPLAGVTFIKADADAGTQLVYTISELVPKEGEPGYNKAMTYDGTVYTVTLWATDNLDGTLTIHTSIKVDGGEVVEWSYTDENGEPAGSPTVGFENTYNGPTDPGELVGSTDLGVSKTIDNRGWYTGETFGFTLTGVSAVDTAGNPIGTVPMPEGAIEGVASLTLSDALMQSNFGSIKFEQAGTYVYQIKEAAGGDSSLTYDKSVYTVTVTVGETFDGTLAVSSIMEKTVGVDGTELEEPEAVADKVAAFTNVFDTSTVRGTYELTGTKSIDGRAFREGDSFTFNVSATEGTPMPDGVDEDGNVTITPAEGTEVNFSFGTIPFTQTGEYVYTVSEAAGSDDRIAYDATIYTVTLSVTDADNNGTFEVAPSVAVDAVAVEGGLVWTNRYTPEATDSVTVAATKNLKGAQLANGQFTFLVTGPDGATLVYTNGEGTEPNEDGVSSSTFDILDGAVYTAEGEYVYTVSEVSDGQPGVTYDATVYQLTVSVTEDTANDKLVATTSIKADTDNDGAFETDADAIVFNNGYVLNPTSVVPQVTKVVDGAGYVMGEGDFTFDMTVTDPEGGQTTATAVNAADGSVTFGAVTFDQEGTYTIAVNEQLPEGVIADNPVADGMTYDTHTVTYTYDVNRDLSTNTLVWALADVDGAEMFTNTYTSSTPVPGSEGAVQIAGTKSIDGRDMTEDDVFTFVLTNKATGQTAATATNAGTDFSFNLGYTNADFTENAVLNDEGKLTETITYTVSEVNGGETIDGVLYDGNSYEVTVTLTDDGKGHIDAQVGYPAGSENGLAFENIYTGSDVTSQTIAVGKTLVGRDMAEGEFSFELQAYDPTTGTMGDKVASTTNDAAANGVRGNVAFGALSYTADMLDGAASKTFYYAVTEVKGTDENITYNQNGNVFYAGVTVTNDGQGNLSSTVTYYTDATCTTAIEDASQAPCFVNAYTPDSIQVPVMGFKSTSTVDAAPLPENLTFGYEIVNVNDPAERYVGTSPANGAIDAAITVDGTGTFTYRITEVNGGTTTGGITYDGSVYYLVLDVKTNVSTGAYEYTTRYFLGDPNNDGTPVDTVSFNNIYGDEVGATLDLSATKTLSGAAFEQLSPFGFTVTETTNGMDKVVATGTTNGASGTTAEVDLSTISYSFRVEQPDEPVVDEGETTPDEQQPADGEETEGEQGTEGTTPDQPAEGTEPGTDQPGTETGGATEPEQPSGGEGETTQPDQPTEGETTEPGGAGEVVEPPAAGGETGEVVEPVEPVVPETPVEETPAQPEVTEEPAAPEAPAEGDVAAASITDLFVASEAIADDVDAEVYTGAVVDETAAAAADETAPVIDETAPVVSETAPAAETETAPTAALEPRVVSSDLGLHTYVISENIPSGAVQNDDGTYTYEGVTYDSHSYVVTVDVQAPYDAATQTVTMTATIKSIDCYDVFGNVVPETVAGSDGCDNVTFANSYYASTPAKLGGTDIQASKTLTGRDMADKEFSFTIAAAADNPDGTLNGTTVAVGTSTAAKANEASAISFGELTFSKPGTYYFSLTEDNAGDTVNGVTYSTRRVRVQRDGDGQLRRHAVGNRELPRGRHGVHQRVQGEHEHERDV